MFKLLYDHDLLYSFKFKNKVSRAEEEYRRQLLCSKIYIVDEMMTHTCEIIMCKRAHDTFTF